MREIEQTREKDRGREKRKKEGTSGARTLVLSNSQTFDTLQEASENRNETLPLKTERNSGTDGRDSNRTEEKGRTKGMRERQKVGDERRMERRDRVENRHTGSQRETEKTLGRNQRSTSIPTLERFPPEERGIVQGEE